MELIRKADPALIDGRVVQKVDRAIRRINIDQADSAIGFPYTYPLDFDLPGG